MELSCLLCGARGPGQLVSSSLRDDDSGRFRIGRCGACGHVQLTPLPTPEEDAAFYDGDGQVRGLGAGVNLEASRRKAAADTARRVAWVQSVAPGDGVPVLDVGCGYGFIVHALAEAGYAATGMDVSADRLALARKAHGGTYVQGYVDQAFVEAHAGGFQVVSLFHVVEHIHDPVPFLQMCHRLLAPGGSLLVEVPNLGDNLLEHAPAYRAFYWQRAHVSYYDAPHMERLLGQAGFTGWRVSGVQRYGVRNLLHWVDEGEPQLVDPDHGDTHPALEGMEEAYRAYRVETLTSDTLIATVAGP